MRIVLLAVLAATVSTAAAAETPRGRECRGEMGKMVAIGLVEKADKTGPTTMDVIVHPARWNVLPLEMKQAVGVTITCVLVEGHEADLPKAEVSITDGNSKPIGKVVGGKLTIF